MIAGAFECFVVELPVRRYHSGSVARLAARPDFIGASSGASKDMAESYRRTGRYPVRISLNVTAETAEVLAFLQVRFRESRGVVARDALSRGLVAMSKLTPRARDRRTRQLIAGGAGGDA